ncbi:MAG: Gfo/Idh/MocA family oxidoreductase [Candidatus Latescibacteria bacterium]|jgi:2-hydroxy-4-carboxymuconate semialdehyde hemiacetal dehydrogenase|nr:Gfo/Idh/MocA family oxidoreductase [Candidatus Latescibacterota bacterium]
MDTLNICLVGYGGIAEHHAQALAQIDGVALHTIVGRRADPAEAFRKKMGFEKVTTSYEDALADADTDAVVIASPSELHYEMTAGALEAGKDVLVEIPLAMSHEGGRRLVGLARKTGRKVLVAHSRRFAGYGRFLKDYIGSGEAGAVHLHQNHQFWFRHENVGWTGYRRSWVDDVLFHHACHQVDFSLWVIGAPVRRVRGELSPLHPKTGTSMDVSMLIRYSNEAIASIGLSYNSPKGVKENVFVCERGTITIAGNSVMLNGETIYEDSGEWESRVLVQDREFVEAIRKDRQPSCNAEDALPALAVLQQVYDQMVTMEGEDKYRRRWGL